MAFVPTAQPGFPFSLRSGTIAVAAVAAAFFLTAQTPAQVISGKPRVLDGDTIVIDKERIRFLAMDAPEIDQLCTGGNMEQRCGIAAKNVLEKWIREGGGVITCQSENRDRYGRLVAVCRVNGEDVGRRLVREGYAVAYRRYGKQYVPDEDEARRNKR